MTKEENFILKDRECAVCGKTFDVVLDKNNEIKDDVFYGGLLRIGIGNWISHTATSDENGFCFVRCISRWQELKYKLIDFKRLILKQYKDIEYWECSECKLKSDMEHGENNRNVCITPEGKIEVEKEVNE